MSINKTQYEIDIEALQNVLKMIHSTPGARLEVESHRVMLTISGEYAWVVHGLQDVGRVLDRTAARFYDTSFHDTNRDVSVKAVLDESVKPERQFVVIVQSDGMCDYVHDAAHSYQVNPNIVETALANYKRNDCFTLVFSLDGQSPLILPNSAKPIGDPLSENIPFAYGDATGRIYQGPDGWGGEFTLGQIQMKLKAEFVGPETVQQELEFIVDTCDNFAIGSETKDKRNR